MYSVKCTKWSYNCFSDSQNALLLGNSATDHCFWQLYPSSRPSSAPPWTLPGVQSTQTDWSCRTLVLYKLHKTPCVNQPLCSGRGSGVRGPAPPRKSPGANYAFAPWFMSNILIPLALCSKIFPRPMPLRHLSANIAYYYSIQLHDRGFKIYYHFIPNIHHNVLLGHCNQTFTFLHVISTFWEKAGNRLHIASISRTQMLLKQCSYPTTYQHRKF